MPDLHLRQPGFFYSTCGPSTSWKDSKLRETGNLKHIYKNELDKAWFAHDAANSDSKDLAKRTISVKNFKDRAYKIVINHKYDGYQRGLASIAFWQEDRIASKSKWRVSPRITQRPVIKKFKRSKVYVRFKNSNIMGCSFSWNGIIIL